MPCTQRVTTPLTYLSWLESFTRIAPLFKKKEEIDRYINLHHFRIHFLGTISQTRQVTAPICQKTCEPPVIPYLFLPICMSTSTFVPNSRSSFQFERSIEPVNTSLPSIQPNLSNPNPHFPRHAAHRALTKPSNIEQVANRFGILLTAMR